MYKYDTLNSTFANQTLYWRTAPSKIAILLDNSFFMKSCIGGIPKNLVFKNLIFDEIALY